MNSLAADAAPGLSALRLVSFIPAERDAVHVGLLSMDAMHVIDLAPLGIPTLEETVKLYCDQTGRDGIPELDWYFSYNAFRLACILQGIAGRVRDGTAASAHATQMIQRIRPLAAASYYYAQRAGLK